MTRIFAIICDCDNTLIPDTTSQLLEKNGIEPQPFWNMIDEMVTKGWDPPLAWMTEIVKLVKEGKISQNSKITAQPHSGPDMWPSSYTRGALWSQQHQSCQTRQP